MKYLLLIIAIAFYGSAIAESDRWELAILVQPQPTQNGQPLDAGGGYKNCFYKTLLGAGQFGESHYEFKVITKEVFCPQQVYVNPETGQYKR